MSIDFDDAWARAIDRTPFSNGTEGDAWTGNWCDRCAVDAPFRNGIAARGCRLLEVALLGRTPAEWFEQETESGLVRLGDQYHCAEFRAQGGGGGHEPRPKPEPTGMDGLFERPSRRVRMFVPAPQDLPAKVGAP